MATNQYYSEFAVQSDNNTGICERYSEFYNNNKYQAENSGLYNRRSDTFNYQAQHGSDFYGGNPEHFNNCNAINQMLPENTQCSAVIASATDTQNQNLEIIADISNSEMNDSSSSSNSPALRALLTNPKKKIKYSPDFYNKISENYSFGNGFKQSILRGGESARYRNVSPRMQVPPTYDVTALSPQTSEQDFNPGYSPSFHIQSPKMTSHTYNGGFPTPPPLSAPEAKGDKHFSPPLSTSSSSSGVEGLVSPPLSPNIQKYASSSQNMAHSAWPQKKGTKEFEEDLKHPKRTRQTYSREQTIQLEQNFSMTSYVSRTQRAVLAKSLNLSERQVKIWFQNRRMKAKKDQGRSSSPSNITQPSCPPMPAVGTQIEPPTTNIGAGRLDLNPPYYHQSAMEFSSLASSELSRPSFPPYCSQPPMPFGYSGLPHQIPYNSMAPPNGYFNSYHPFFNSQAHSPTDGSGDQNLPDVAPNPPANYMPPLPHSHPADVFAV